MARLTASANGPDGIADFGHTASMGLVLPEGLGFTSGSGAFLTAPVPEPASGLLWSAGIGALLARLARHPGAKTPPAASRRATGGSATAAA